jgi:hypothetical protein
MCSASVSAEARSMNAQLHVDEQCLTVADVAERLKVKPDTVRRLFIREPGVIVIYFPRKGKRVYRTLRIPVSVYQRVLTRLMHVG